MKKYFLVLTVMVMSACTTAKTVSLPDGATGYSISCGGKINSFASCFEKAGEMCGAKGYNIVNGAGEVLPYSYSSGSISGNRSGFSGGYESQSGAFVHRSLFIKCKK